MQAKIERFEHTIRGQLKELQSLIPLADLVAPEVSHWSVGEHLEHCALAVNRTAQGFEIALMTGPQAVPGGPSLAAKIILWTGFIPRGKGKAPKAVEPKKLDADALHTALEKERNKLRELKPKIPGLIAAGWKLPHPIFGPLTPLQWLRFTEIHIRHHVKVIDDIRKVAE